MNWNIRRTIASFLSITVIGTPLLNPSLMFAQQGSQEAEGSSAQQNIEPTGAGRPPRPDLTFDGQTTLGRGGNEIRIFRENGKDSTDETAHWFYEPLIFPVTDEAGKLKTRIDDDGHLILYVIWDDNRKSTKESIHSYLVDKYGSKVSSAAMIQMFFVADSWFESKRAPGIKSYSFKNHSFAGTGEVQVHFRMGSREAADEFVASLQGEEDELEFWYSFTGDADLVCSTEASYEVIQKIRQFKDLSGEGGVGRVSRHQVSTIAENITRTIKVKSRCSSSALAALMTERAMDQLGAPDVETLEDSWENLKNFTTLSAKDFAADLERRVKNIRNEVHRRNIQDIVSEAKSRGGSGGVGLTFGKFWLGINGSAAWADSDLRSTFIDLLDKVGISTEWEGEKFVPKNIEVYRKEDLERAWSGGVTLEYSIPNRTEAQYSILVGKDNWSDTKRVHMIRRIALYEDLFSHIHLRHYDITLDRRDGMFDKGFLYDTRLPVDKYPFSLIINWESDSEIPLEDITAFSDGSDAENIPMDGDYSQLVVNLLTHEDTWKISAGVWEVNPSAAPIKIKVAAIFFAKEFLDRESKQWKNNSRIWRRPVELESNICDAEVRKTLRELKIIEGR